MKLIKAIKDTATTFTGLLSIIISFLLISGVPIILIGHLINKPYIYGIGYTIFAFYVAPNGIAIFGIIVLAPLINRIVFRSKK